MGYQGRFCGEYDIFEGELGFWDFVWQGGRVKGEGMEE